MPADLGDPLWSEIDADNNSAAPGGWPDGQAPSTVKQTARGMMGAIKRFWDRSNTVLTTAGTSTAYTLTNAAAEAAYYSGEEFAFIVHATCGAVPTLNIDGLGARNLRKFAGGAWSNLVSGDIQANQPLRVYYNLANTSFDVVGGPTGAWQAPGSQTLVAASSYSLQNIAASINHLDIFFDLTFSSNNVSLYLQFYDSGGTLDASAVYGTVMSVTDTSGGMGARLFPAASAILLGSAINSSTALGCSGRLSIINLQGVKRTSCNWQSQWIDQAGVVGEGASGWGNRAANGPITGFKLSPSSGMFSGEVTPLETNS